MKDRSRHTLDLGHTASLASLIVSNAVSNVLGLGRELCGGTRLEREHDGDSFTLDRTSSGRPSVSSLAFFLGALAGLAAGAALAGDASLGASTLTSASAISLFFPSKSVRDAIREIL